MLRHRNSPFVNHHRESADFKTLKEKLERLAFFFIEGN